MQPDAADAIHDVRQGVVSFEASQSFQPCNATHMSKHQLAGYTHPTGGLAFGSRVTPCSARGSPTPTVAAPSSRESHRPSGGP